LTATHHLQGGDGQPAAGAHGTASDQQLTVLFRIANRQRRQGGETGLSSAAGAGIHAVAVSTGGLQSREPAQRTPSGAGFEHAGEGDPPDSAVEFHRFLFGKRAPRLEGLRFAVLALGDYSYANFCKAGADFDNA
jgi:sulfite reductase (NADPH) flavoprotein alpha-component